MRGNQLILAAAAAAAVVAAIAGEGHGQIVLCNASESAQIDALHTPQQSFTTLRWMTGGMAVGDFDRDGHADLFVASGGGTPDRVYMNDGFGTFADEAASWGLGSVLHSGNAVAVGDYNGDGWHDVYVTSMGQPGSADAPGANRLYRNTGRGLFIEVAAAAGVNFASPVDAKVFGAAFGDYDLDGNLDLFVCTWAPGVAGNRLYRNLGDGTFQDMTASAIGEAELNPVLGFQPAFTDMNGDLFPEILIAADFETSRYLANQGDGTFMNLTSFSGTGLDDNGMGQTVGDFDHDGLLDWYVTSIFNDVPPPGNTPGNMHYRQVAAHTYEESADLLGDRDGGWGWGTIAVDLDQDGWEDIVEVNGREANPANQWTAEQAYLWHNDGDGTFTEMAVASGLDHDDSGRCIVWFDAENDGDLDMAIMTNQGPVEHYRNDTIGGSWLQLELDTSGNPLLAPDGFQSRVEATTGGETLVRYLNGAPSYLGTSQLIVHLGVGAAKTIDELEIIWSRGYRTVMQDVAVDRKLVIVAPALADLNADGAVSVGDLIELILRWGVVSDSTQLVADLDDNGEVDVLDMVTLILAWTG